MATFTKERLQQLIRAIDSGNFDEEEIVGRVNSDEILELARIALASLEAEPVAWIVHCRGGDQLTTDGDYVANAEGMHAIHSTPLYSAPPAPVVPDSGREQFEEWFKFHHGEDGSIVTLHRANGGANYCDEFVDLAWIAWKDSRAAMQGKAEPVSNRDELPSREHFISLCNQFWNWQEADEINAGDEEPRLEWNGSAFTHRVTQALWRMYQASPGNSPVIPDGWVLVPVEPTREMKLQIHPIAEATCMDCGRTVTADCEDNVLLSWADMIAAAPQQEVKSALAKGMERYGDAMQELAKRGVK